MLSRNFHRSARKVNASNGRNCLRWLREHEAKGEMELAAKVRASLRGYIAASHILSQDQKRMDGIWSKMPTA